MSNKEKENTKLNKIKTDLEIKLVKMELQKIKLQESQLQESQLQEDLQKGVIKSVVIKDSLVVKELDKNKESKEGKKAIIIVKNSADKKEKKNPSKPIFYILGVLLLLVLISTLTIKYINNLKSEIQNKEQLLIDNEKENINFDSNEFFKDVEDEVTDDELQDFANYKDVPEIVVNNKNNNKDVNVSEIINNQINKANNTKETPVEKVVEQTDAVKKPEITNVEQNAEIIKTNKEKDSLENNKNLIVEEAKITSDFIKVIALQYKDKKYKIPKKAKKTNSFSVRVRLNKFKKTSINNKVKIMLVIKNTVGKTLKIDIKEVDFTKIKTTYITFYETFSNNLEINAEYSFSILANDKLIKNSTKRI